MKTIYSTQLLETLGEQTRAIILEAEKLKNTSPALLEISPAAGKWSVAQVLEHLNIYCRYYLAAIEKKLHHNKTGASLLFYPGWLGNYFTKMMEPSANGIIKKKIKAPAGAQPALQPNACEMLNEFIRHQHHLLNLIQVANQHDLNTTRIPTSLTKLVSLKLGDTYRFIIAHQQRHFIQISNVIKDVTAAVKSKTPVMEKYGD